MKQFMEIDVLDVLDQMDEFRRNHQNRKQDPPDYCMRVLEAILARAAGYPERTAWTKALRNMPSRYSRDLNDTEKIWRF